MMDPQILKGLPPKVLYQSSVNLNKRIDVDPLGSHSLTNILLNFVLHRA